MKDIPHHIKKLNRRVIRSNHREEVEEDSYEIPQLPLSTHQQKKQAKAKKRQERQARTPVHPTEEARNRAMKHRVPVFDRDSNEKPRLGARPTHKKTPPL